MNLSPVSVVIAGTGGILIYSAVRGYDPRDVVKSALSGEWPPAQAYAVGSGGGNPYSGGKSPIPPMPADPSKPKSGTKKKPDTTHPTTDTIPTRVDV